MLVLSDLYLRGAELQRTAFVQMVTRVAERIGVATTDESTLHPIGMVKDVLVGDPMPLR